MDRLYSTVGDGWLIGGWLANRVKGGLEAGRLIGGWVSYRAMCGL
jgi:hypothetical protein